MVEMAPMPLRQLTALQASRLAEIELTSNRLKDRARDSLNLNIIAARIDALLDIWTKARATHEEIIVREDSANDPYVTGNVFARLQIAYEDTLDFLFTTKSELDSASFNPGSSGAGSTSDADSRVAKLPKLDLPTFAGRYEDWENFCDLFTTLVHNAPRLTDATKLQYLKSCLKDTAADLVKDVTTTDANYASTWQALKARFHNPRLTVYNHLRALIDIPHARKESASEMRSLADESQRIVRALSNLKMPVEHWDVWLVFIIASKLDPDSRKAWESELSKRDRRVLSESGSDAGNEQVLARFPKFAELTEFLENRAQTLGMLAAENSATDRRTTTSIKQVPGARKIFHAATLNRANGQLKCPKCAGAHRIYKCYQFKALNPSERLAVLRRLRLCFNCFGTHRIAECSSTLRCSVCREKHNAMIHNAMHAKIRDVGNKPCPSDENGNEHSNTSSTVKVHTANVLAHERSVLLATAQLTVLGAHGARMRVRALLDQGSEASFVSDAIANLLRLEKRRVSISLTGLGASSAGRAKAITRLVMQSLVDPSVRFETEALILTKITSHLPSRQLVEIDLDMFADLPLADPQFYVPDSIDIILGADLYGQLLRSGLKTFPTSPLVAQDTALGWIISGPMSTGGSRRAVTVSQDSFRTHHCATRDDLDASLQRFWSIEEVPSLHVPSDPQDDVCEELFKRTHRRDEGGRYIVHLPFSSELPDVGAETRSMALRSLAHTHRRFERDSNLASAYRKFMSTYEELGHMKRVPASDVNKSKAWYLPHHAVGQTKMRVVFDASRKNQRKECLNDFLMKGPALQRDLSLVLLNWRQYRFVFTADIVKMFRQIRVASEHQDSQRIVWSPSRSDPPVDYRLTTVTYGTACAPYLAIRTLLQVASDEGSRFPLGAQCLKFNTYVDDTFAGADELSVAMKIRQELIAMLRSAGIELDKWAANHSDLLPSRTKSLENNEVKSITDDDSVKTLGICWSQRTDEFSFTTLNFKELAGAATKRAILSNIARLFDPLGWLAPITVTAKILMQDLWILKCDWDDALPADVRERWLEYCHSLSELPKLRISRWLGVASTPGAQLHGFSDASSRAYAAVVYIRVPNGDGHFRTSLLAAKSKVAPVKTLSIPNLELCGAMLLVKLLCHVKGLEFLQNIPIFAWTDSQIVLTWLRKHPCSWKTFIANTVSFIQTELPSATWLHVPTKENPADLSTRGCKPLDLLECVLWWHGPEWLAMSDAHWPKATSTPRVLHVNKAAGEPELFSRFSSWTRLIQIVAYCLRPLNNLRRRRSDLDVFPAFLTARELCEARNAVIRLAQNHAFAAELELLRQGKQLPKRHALLSLNPFFDESDRVLRVGGRLENSSLQHERKHPPILPRNSTLSRLIVQHAHRVCLHGGPTLTSNTVMRYAWILGRNRIVKTTVRACVVCQRNKPRLAHQMMGNLPASRVTPARPFSSAGLDYAGPFPIRTTKGRGHKSYKGYIALFVCFATRAIHLEAVGDLTTNSFLAAYRRFVSRRGICKNLYSDNATTFQAADKELRAMFKAGSEFYKSSAASLANDGTSWTFIPPTAPHYGGLWEAGVKSVKHHLKRAFNDKVLTFEEFSTVLAEIEACLNSRPICPLTADINDVQVLTPAHFLIGGSSALVPDDAPPDVPVNRLERFKLLQTIRNHFWKRWALEYMQYLQERAKWRSPSENFAVGQLVLVRDDRYPPSKWPLGRVTEVHLGSDGLVRVVTVKTATSVLRRHVARLCPLFTERSPVQSDTGDHAK